jgi:hypothetical protein
MVTCNRLEGISLGKSRSYRARAYYDASHARFQEAQFLLERGNFPTGAVDLAGYGVECILKAVILESARDEKRRKQIVDSFAGQAGHDMRLSHS